jgi:hypothetical protein
MPHEALKRSWCPEKVGGGTLCHSGFPKSYKPSYEIRLTHMHGRTAIQSPDRNAWDRVSYVERVPSMVSGRSAGPWTPSYDLCATLQDHAIN